MAKNSASPSMTTQRVSMPTPPALASRVWSSSATPPPVAVELTLSTVRPAKDLAGIAAAVASNTAARSGPMTASRRSGATGGTCTSCSPMRPPGSELAPRMASTGAVRAARTVSLDRDPRWLSCAATR